MFIHGGVPEKQYSIMKRRKRNWYRRGKRKGKKMGKMCSEKQ